MDPERVSRDAEVYPLRNEESSHVMQQTDAKKCSSASQNVASSQLNSQSGGRKPNQPNLLCPGALQDAFRKENSETKDFTTIRGGNSFLKLPPLMAYFGSMPHLEEEQQKVKKSSLSMVDLKDSVTEDLPPQTSKETKLSLTNSHGLYFRKGFPFYCQKDYGDPGLEQIRDRRLMSGLWSSPRILKGTLSVISNSIEMSPLKKRTCNVEVLPKADKSENLRGKGEKFDIDESDASFSSAGSGSSEDSNFVATSPIRENGDVPSNLGPALNLNEPIRLGCIDEATGCDMELLIYTDEFFEKVTREKGTKFSKRDILESVLECCRNYEGKRVRVILDKEKFQSDTPSTHKEISSETHTNAHQTPSAPIRPRKNTCSAPCRMKVNSNDSRQDSENKWRNDFQKFHEGNVSYPFAVLSAESLSKKGAKQLSMEDESETSFRFRQPVHHRAKKVAESCSALGDGKVSRTSLRVMNVEKIIASDFGKVFHAYAKYGGRLKSGAVMSKSNSHLWCRRAGVIYDESTERISEECFTVIARSKLVLNISDYLQYLAAVARRRRLCLNDLVTWMINADSPHPSKRPSDASNWSHCNEESFASKADAILKRF